MGIDLHKVDKIVLSHGHADHTGGLMDVLGQIGKKIEIVAHPDVVDAKYSGKQEDKRKNIALPFSVAGNGETRGKFQIEQKTGKNNP